MDTVLLAEGEPRRINPDLARVLRSQILWKDDFWLMLETEEPLEAGDDGHEAGRAAGVPTAKSPTNGLRNRHVFDGERVDLAYSR